jgi:biopolymer transport protein ExbB
VWSIVQAAGWPIWPLIFASVIALALIFERLWSLRQSIVAPPGLVDRVLTEYRANGATPELINRIAQQGPLGRILATGLANVKSPRAVIKEAIEEVGRVVTHDLERFLTTLGTIAAMSPLLGLFGTVVGMIEIFGSQTAGGSNPLQLAHGISVALYNTGLRPDRRDPEHDLLPPLPRDDRQPGRRDGAAGDQARRLRAWRAPLMNLRGARTRDDPEINFIPLIDVLLVILIFLMVTTTYQRVAELQITLPEGRRRGAQAAAQGDQRGRGRAGALRHQQDRIHVHDDRRARGCPQGRGRRREGPGRHHQRRRHGDAPVGHPRDGSLARRRLRARHVRDPVSAAEVTA